MRSTNIRSIVFFFLLLLSFASSSPPPPPPPPPSSTCATELQLISSTNTTILPFNSSSLRCVSGLDFLGYSMLYEQKAENLWSFVVTAPSDVNSYVGVGFSPTGRMVGSSAVVGWVWSNGTTTALQYDLRAQTPSECVPNAGVLRLVEGSTMLAVYSSRIFLAFQLNVRSPRDRIIFSIGPEGFRPGPNLLLVEHRAAQSIIIDYSAGQTTKVKFSEKLKTIHGILAMVGWGVLVPIGITVARYGKQWDPLWFYSHLSIQTTGFALGIAAVVTGFRYEHTSLSDVDTHKAIGITILVLGFLQVMAFFLRPDKKARVRRYWNWYQHNVGRAAMVLAIANIYYGFHLGDAPRAWRVAFGIFLGLLLAVSLVLELLSCIRKSRNEK